MPGAARRQHQNGNGHAVFAPAAQQRQAVHQREPEIEDDRIVVLGRSQKFGTLSVVGPIDGIAGCAKRAGQLVGQALLIFDQKHSHGGVRHLIQRT
jgi:hypothetical protein